MEISVEVGVLARPQRLVNRICDVIEASGWKVHKIGKADLTGRDSLPWDVTLLVADSVVRDMFNELIQAASVPGVPVIVVGTMSDPQVIADMLRAGADDYIVHPFAAEELIARVENLVNRFQPQEDVRNSDCIKLDPSNRTIVRGHSSVVLSPREWALLESLLEHDERCVSLASLAQMEGLCGLTESAIVSTVSRLRRRLLETHFEGLAIQTIRGCGYQLRRLDVSDCFGASETMS